MEMPSRGAPHHLSTQHLQFQLIPSVVLDFVEHNKELNRIFIKNFSGGTGGLSSKVSSLWVGGLKLIETILSSLEKELYKMNYKVEK